MSTAMVARNIDDLGGALGIIGPIRDCPEVRLRGNPGRAAYCTNCLAVNFCVFMFDSDEDPWEVLARFVGDSENCERVLANVQVHGTPWADANQENVGTEAEAATESLAPQHKLPARKVEV